MCDMTHSYVWHDSFICVTWLNHMCDIHMCDTTHSYVWHDSFICAWLIHMCDMTRSRVRHSYVWHDSFICVTWLIHMCDMTHSHVWHDSLIWHEHTSPHWADHQLCDTTPFIGVTWLNLMCDMTQTGTTIIEYTTNCVTWRIHMCTWLTRECDIHTCEMTHSYMWHDSLMCATWLHSCVWRDSFTCATGHDQGPPL